MKRESDIITRKGLIQIGEAVTSLYYMDIDTGLILSVFLSVQ